MFLGLSLRVLEYFSVGIFYVLGIMCLSIADDAVVRCGIYRSRFDDKLEYFCTYFNLPVLV